MAIRYGCFFSYAHGQHELMNRFKTALADAMRCYLEPYFDNEDELFIDTEQLGGGDDIDRKIARAHVRERVHDHDLHAQVRGASPTRGANTPAMQLLEAERSQWYTLPSHLIIPVIMTQHPDRPAAADRRVEHVRRFFAFHDGHRPT